MEDMIVIRLFFVPIAIGMFVGSVCACIAEIKKRDYVGAAIIGGVAWIAFGLLLLLAVGPRLIIG